ncbi:nicotinate-nucleotide-dimethylbenzimidazole phosphoribosyltransferase [Kushneria avicenniae]|uniref:Nicotinate-nucleotide--dimethylbenzimidazole phosphoribosyltransferase n=1 Tax=Kushneria avicenniae TaxID=402385 RepID=A0A1I1FW22_9GAMM|nr:nicotinate-nucleotide--dimethylbenzimidazole phosphoribosyltransferase [Kushneria avicenniae]SFC01180.1 nicotinate-nucleotide-dimethylbenzimidazole phosphoribosyltransferase [Kushneria avicenniae]
MTFHISPPDGASDASIQAHIDSRLKPPGSLGTLETTAASLVRILGPSRTTIDAPVMLLFAGDHGVAAEGVSIVDPSTTQLMVHHFLEGNAAINVFCRQADLALRVIDCGTLTAHDPHPQLVSHRLGEMTAPFHREPAMTLEQLETAFANSRRLVDELHADGCNLIALGEMGIGNTTSASALMAALTHLPFDVCIGAGSGVTSTIMKRKQDIVQLGLQRHSQALKDTRSALAALGGFEIASMVGAILAAAEKSMVILVDGFITTVAALCACRIEPAVRGYLIFSHCGDERGHKPLLNQLEAEPLLHMGLRLGEGSGAALALPLLRSALAFYHEMASLDDAGLTL